MTGLEVTVVAQAAIRTEGQGRVALEVVRALADRGHHVTVLAHRLDEEMRGRVRWRSWRTAPGPQLLDDLAFLVRSSISVWRSKPDVVCAFGPTALTTRPLVVSMQFSHRGWRASWRPGQAPGLGYRTHARVLTALEDLCVGQADHLIASAPLVVEHSTARHRPPSTVVPLGIDLDEFSPVDPAERRAERDRHGFDDDTFVLGFLGEYHTRRKGLEELVTSLTDGPGDEVILAGGNGDRPRLEGLARSLGVADRLRLPGFLPARSVIAAADLVVVPSVYEPFSLVALEAAACRVPVVISAAAGAADQFPDGMIVVGEITGPAIRNAIDRARSFPTRTLVDRADQQVRALEWRALGHRNAEVIEAAAKR